MRSTKVNAKHVGDVNNVLALFQRQRAQFYFACTAVGENNPCANKLLLVTSAQQHFTYTNGTFRSLNVHKDNNAMSTYWPFAKLIPTPQC